jgi:hypothetical protein
MRELIGIKRFILPRMVVFNLESDAYIVRQELSNLPTNILGLLYQARLSWAVSRSDSQFL